MAMNNKARIWIGVTLLILIAFNYLTVSFPLYKRILSLENKIKIMMIKQVKSGEILKNSEDSYIIDVLKRETISLDRKIVIINCVAASAVIAIISWLAYGLIVHRTKKGKKR